MPDPSQILRFVLLSNSYDLIQVMQEEVMPNFASNGVRDFGDGMANSEVGMSLNAQVSF